MNLSDLRTYNTIYSLNLSEKEINDISIEHKDKSKTGIAIPVVKWFGGSSGYNIIVNHDDNHSIKIGKILEVNNTTLFHPFRILFSHLTEYKVSDSLFRIHKILNNYGPRMEISKISGYIHGHDKEQEAIKYKLREITRCINCNIKGKTDNLTITLDNVTLDLNIINNNYRINKIKISSEDVRKVLSIANTFKTQSNLNTFLFAVSKTSFDTIMALSNDKLMISCDIEDTAGLFKKKFVFIQLDLKKDGKNIYITFCDKKNRYAVTNFKLLDKALSYFKRRVITPKDIEIVSNLLYECTGRNKDIFSDIITSVHSDKEINKFNEKKN